MSSEGEWDDGRAAADKLKLDRLTKEIRAYLITAAQSGLSRKEIERDYKDNNGKELQSTAAELGFGSVDELLACMPEAAKRVAEPGGQARYFPVTDETTWRLVSLVERQRPSGNVARFGGTLPVEQRKDIMVDRLRSLLESSSMTLNHLKETFQKKFGEPIQSQRYYSCELRELFTEHLSNAFELVKTSSGSEMVRRKKFSRSLSDHSLNTAKLGGTYGPGALSNFLDTPTAAMQLPPDALVAAPAQIQRQLTSTSSTTALRGRANAAAAGVTRFPAPVSFPSLGGFPSPAAIAARPTPSRAAAAAADSQRRSTRPRLPAGSPASPLLSHADMIAWSLNAVRSSKTGVTSNELEELLSERMGAPFRIESVLGISWRSFAAQYLTVCQVFDAPTNADPTAIHLRLRQAARPATTVDCTKQPPADTDAAPPSPQPDPAQRGASPAIVDVALVQKMKEDLCQVFRTHPGGVYYENFESVFEETLARPMDLKSLDFWSLSDLVYDAAFGDVVRFENVDGLLLLPAEHMPAAPPPPLDHSSIHGWLVDRLSSLPHRSVSYATALEQLSAEYGREVAFSELQEVVFQDAQLFRSHFPSSQSLVAEALIEFVGDSAPSCAPLAESAPSAELGATSFQSIATAEESSGRLSATPADAVGVAAPFARQNLPLTAAQLDALHPADRRRHVRVIVTQYETPVAFYAVRADLLSEMLALMKRMTSFYVTEGGEAYRVAAERVVEGLPVAAFFSTGDASSTDMHRAVVRLVSGGTAEVFFVDFGTTDYIDSAALYHLRAEFVDCLAAQAIHFRMSDTLVPDGGESWDDETGQRVFLQTCDDPMRLTMAVVEDVERDNTCRLSDVRVYDSGGDALLMSLLDEYERNGVVRRPPPPLADAPVSPAAASGPTAPRADDRQADSPDLYRRRLGASDFGSSGSERSFVSASPEIPDAARVADVSICDAAETVDEGNCVPQADIVEPADEAGHSAEQQWRATEPAASDWASGCDVEEELAQLVASPEPSTSARRAEPVAPSAPCAPCGRAAVGAACVESDTNASGGVSPAYPLYERFADGLRSAKMTVAAVKMALKVKVRQRDKRYRTLEDGDLDEDADALQLATELSQMDREIELIQELVRQHEPRSAPSTERRALIRPVPSHHGHMSSDGFLFSSEHSEDAGSADTEAAPVMATIDASAAVPPSTLSAAAAEFRPAPRPSRLVGAPLVDPWRYAPPTPIPIYYQLPAAHPQLVRPPDVQFPGNLYMPMASSSPSLFPLGYHHSATTVRQSNSGAGTPTGSSGSR